MQAMCAGCFKPAAGTVDEEVDKMREHRHAPLTGGLHGVSSPFDRADVPRFVPFWRIGAGAAVLRSGQLQNGLDTETNGNSLANLPPNAQRRNRRIRPGDDDVFGSDR
jgi:hypothetical protein